MKLFYYILGLLTGLVLFYAVIALIPEARYTFNLLEIEITYEEAKNQNH